MLPSDFPPYRCVHYYFRKWALDGTWQRLSLLLVMADRKKKGREASPSLAVIDSQSVKNSERGVGQKGFDGFKKIQGRKRHVAVDALGNVLCVHVTPANVHDAKAAPDLLTRLAAKGLARISRILGDGAYAGKELKEWAKQSFGFLLEEAKGLCGGDFSPSPKRWVIERTFSHFGWKRRLAKDYEDDPKSSESYIYIAQIALSLKSLCP